METLGIALVTDYDSGLAGNVESVTHSEVLKVFEANIENLRKLLFELIALMPNNKSIWKDQIINSSRHLY